MNKSALASALLVAPLVLLSQSAWAGPNYTYIDLEYISADLDDGPTLDGWGIAGSVAFTENVHGVAGYGQLSKGRLDADLYSAGLGYNYGLTTNTDFVIRGGWARVEVDLRGFGSESEDGWFAEAGVRSMVTELLELNGFINHSDIGGSDTSLAVGAVYHLTPNLGIRLAGEISDDATIWSGGIRFTF